MSAQIEAPYILSRETQQIVSPALVEADTDVFGYSLTTDDFVVDLGQLFTQHPEARVFFRNSAEELWSLRVDDFGDGPEADLYSFSINRGETHLVPRKNGKLLLVNDMGLRVEIQ